MKRIVIIAIIGIFTSCVEEDDVWKMDGMFQSNEEVIEQIESPESNPGLISPGHDGLFD